MNYKKIVDSSFNRLLKHIQNPFFIVSAFRSDNTKEENREAFNKLAKYLRDEGLGFIVLNGKWIEDVDGEKVEVDERSMFVPQPKDWRVTSDDWLNLAVGFAESFNQEAVIVKSEGQSPIAQWLNDGEWVQNMTWSGASFNISGFEKAWSQIHSGRDSHWKFKFVDTVRAKCWAQAIGLTDKGYIL